MMLFGAWDWLLLLGTLVGGAVYYFWRKAQFFKDRNIKSENGKLILGSVFDLYVEKEHILDFLEDIYKKYPKERYVGLLNFTTPVFLVKDPELIRRITVKDFDHFMDHLEFTDEEVDPLSGKMLFALKGEKWREMRNTLSPAFTSSKMRAMLPFMQECVDNVIIYFNEEIKKQTSQGKDYADLEFKDTYTRYTNDVIASCGCGIKINSLKDKNNEFYNISRKFTQFKWTDAIKLLIFFLCPYLMKVFNIQFVNKDVAKFLRDLVRNNMKEREENHIVRQDMIHLLMLAKQGNLHDDSITEAENKQLNKKKKTEWTEDELTAQVFVFLFAGFESSATLISFLTYELAINPETQKKLQQEIDDYMKATNGKVDYEGVHSLKYLDMAISETLRLWPVAPNTDRLCTKPYTFPPQNDTDNVQIELKKGDTLWIPTAAIHRDPKYFPNPNQFDPERFSDENKSSILPFTYFPFGTGPRTCIASRFALMETKVLMVNVLSKFEFIRTPKTPVPMVLKKSLFDMVAKDGFWAGVKSRNKCQ